MVEVNRQRLWDRLMALAEIGRQPDGGVTRLAFTPEWRRAKERVAGFMREAGLEVREDTVGNLIGRWPGRRPELPVVLTGSHLDSVFHGGNFDGPLGVLAAVEALQTLRENGIETDHPVEVVSFTDEEGARFRFGMTGSRAVAGTLTAEDLEHRDADGVSIAEAMRAYGLDPAAFREAARSKGSVKAYVELHIEQGRVLENAGLAVGVVSGMAGPLWLRFTVEGEAGHAGATPMNLRRDPLVGAAAIVQAIEAECRRHAHTVGTVGQLQVHPGGVNIIPGRVEFTLDLRDVDEAERDSAEAAILAEARAVCAARGLGLTVETLQRIPPVPCAPAIQRIIGDACGQLGMRSITLVSGAGHDGMQLRDLCPVGMVFVRSKDGISHDPAEYTSPEDCAAGADVLMHTLLQLASEAVQV
ncbi:Zn-dependent hydrolase [Alicyclobacillus macrosporangiidus]|uniref:Zn-dependent hydrolase n=1 Tax=Alicyclobacillus macrosporangiidus TaxID=392015 RepID=UPI000497B3A8|nr:Zn-dependent hydrolase [Alicyclobacillus macrosporangiidus]